MRKLTDTDLKAIWQRIKAIHHERENLRKIEDQIIEYDVQRHGLLVRRKDRTFTTA